MSIMQLNIIELCMFHLNGILISSNNRLVLQHFTLPQVTNEIKRMVWSARVIGKLFEQKYFNFIFNSVAVDGFKLNHLHQ